jgi:hemerythrin-like domain-containing protein
MAEWMGSNALELLKNDHRKVQRLLGQFEDAGNFQNKKKVAEEALSELKVHSKVEEEIFYPAVRKEIDNVFLVNLAREEHHVAKVLMAELDELDGNDETFEAKFSVLSEIIRHHITEEEEQIFPQIKKTGIDLDSLGKKISQRKEKLLVQGVPVTPEETMVKYGHEDEPLSDTSTTDMRLEGGADNESAAGDA